MLTKLIVLNKPLKAVARKLLENKYFVTNPVYRFVYNKRKKSLMREYGVKPDRVRLENTNICHANCKFCPHPKMKREQGIMDMNLFRKLAHQIKDWGVNEIVIQGFGEPLSDPYFFDRVEYARKIGIPKIQTNINSRYITNSMADMLLGSSLNEIFVSLNKQGMKKAEYLLSQPRPPHMKIYLSQIMGETDDFRLLNRADGVSTSYPHNWGGSQYQTDYHYPKDPCRLCFVTMYITWDGFAHICCMDYEASYKYGDAKKIDLRQLWQWHPYQYIHRQGKWDDLPICKNCSYNEHRKSPWWVK